METIQQVVDSILASMPGASRSGLVDTFKTGDPSMEVTGIVTTFTASFEILQQAVAQQANLVITHEPTFYEHLDQTDWLADDPVFHVKHSFIQQNQLTIWRLHDNWHMYASDGIITGVARSLDWEAYAQEDWALFIIPGMTVEKLVATLKQRLGISTVRVVGNLQQPCERIGLIVGAIGGEAQVQLFQQMKLNALICGETVEWQTCEYVRDATTMGQHKALLILGHANSEEAGMSYLAEWLRPKFPHIPITHLTAGDPIKTC